MQNYHCPHCSRELTKELFNNKILYRCSACGGQYITLSALRGLCRNKEFPNRLWRSASRSQAVGVTCPACQKHTRQVLLYPDIDSALELDVCQNCQSVWFDPAELESLPLNEIPEDKLSPEAKKAIADYTIAYVKETAKYQNSPITGWSVGSPYDIWKTLPALLGLPVEQDFDALRLRPYITWFLAGLCIAVHLLSFQDLKTVISTWGFIPGEMFRYMGATWISSMFLHGGWLHLLGNMYFLLIFGDNVEDEFGHWKYLALIFAGGICASLIHALADIRSTIPCVGASGFISSILACYAICFPNRKISISAGRFFIFLYRVSLPAWTVFILWVIVQIVWAAQINPMGGGTAYFAHLGGAAAGIAAAVIYKFRQRKNSPVPSLFQKLTQK